MMPAKEQQRGDDRAVVPSVTQSANEELAAPAAEEWPDDLLPNDIVLAELRRGNPTNAAD